jgi:DNA-binding transcriptional LysR family regulator
VSGLKVNDADTALKAVRVGLGPLLLPTSIEDRDKRLRRLRADERQLSEERECTTHRVTARDSAVSSGQLEVDFASDQVGDRDEIAQ